MGEDAHEDEDEGDDGDEDEDEGDDEDETVHNIGSKPPLAICITNDKASVKFRETASWYSIVHFSIGFLATNGSR